MPEPSSTTRIDVQILAERQEVIHGSSLLRNMQRLALGLHDLPSDSVVAWQLGGQLRAAPGGEDAVHLHLSADAVVPLVCQRCLAPVSVALHVDNRYRFVADEDIAMREDDESAEDLLVWDENFNLTPLLEDELLMALPVVPMHDQCPSLVATQSDQLDGGAGATPKPNPFAALARLKTPKIQGSGE
jgi:uncharacterized protein